THHALAARLQRQREKPQMVCKRARFGYRYIGATADGGRSSNGWHSNADGAMSNGTRKAAWCLNLVHLFDAVIRTINK
ncbi:MAG: hypothetical protein NZ876_04490, partial [Dehalococcoidia bacterium]|nr:hypothetical protein [Dehalococcoidia bacterium]